MSTRRGNVKFLDDIIDDVGNFMHEVMRRNDVKYRQVENPARTAEILGISAIMVCVVSYSAFKPKRICYFL